MLLPDDWARGAGRDRSGSHRACRLSTVILPVYPWARGQEVWRRAEALGFHAGYTYDHLSWQSFRDRTWFGGLPP